MAVNTTTEKRIKKIEDELKAMKACYNTAGSLVKMYVTKMGAITTGGGAGLHNMVIRFIPTYGMGQINLITLVAIVDSNTYYVAPFATTPQSGSGAVDITIFDLVATQKVEVIASGTSPGTFMRIA